MKKITLKSDSSNNINIPNSVWTIIGIILLIFGISFISTCRDSMKSKVKTEAREQRDTYKKNIKHVTHKINAGETVYFDFQQMIKRSIVKIKDAENKNGVRLDFEYFPSGSTGYYTDNHPDPKAYEYSDTGVYVKSSETVTLTLSLL